MLTRVGDKHQSINKSTLMQDVTTFKHTCFIMDISGHTFIPPPPLKSFLQNFQILETSYKDFLKFENKLIVNYRFDKNKNNEQYIHKLNLV